MCGILGTINLDFEPPLLDSLAHRGPDASGLVKLSVGTNQVILGHRRLAIVDVTPAGHQPMVTPSRSEFLVFNGEIYNHLELRGELNDVRFHGHSDTETILHLIAQQGIDSVTRFNGIFALAYLDQRRRKLFLVRDPFGVKPLYYWYHDRACVFCSELKPIARLIDCRVDSDSLAELLRLRYLPAPDTLFQGVKKLRPGHLLEIDLAADPRIADRPYAIPPTRCSNIRYADALAQYGDLLRQAVQRQMMSDVEIGVMLSGGVDSALVASLAQRSANHRLKAFTVGYNETDDSDEVVDAAETASSLGLHHHIVRVDYEDFLRTCRRCVSIVEEPLATTSLVPMFHLTRLAAQHVRVVLSGQGSDEAFVGYCVLY